MSGRARSTSLCLQTSIKVETQRFSRRASSFRSCLKKNSSDFDTLSEEMDKDRRKSSCRSVMFSDEIGDNLVTSVFNYDEAEPAVINIDDIDAIDDHDFPDDIELPDPFEDWVPPIADEPKVNTKPTKHHEKCDENKSKRVVEFEELDVECVEDEFVIPLEENTPTNERLQIVFVKNDSDDEMANDVKISIASLERSSKVNSLSETTRCSGASIHGNRIKSLAGAENAECGDLEQSDRFADHLSRYDANGNHILPIQQTCQDVTGLISAEKLCDSGKADTDDNSIARPPSITSLKTPSIYQAEKLSDRESSEDKSCYYPPPSTDSSSDQPGCTLGQINETENIAAMNQVKKDAEFGDVMKENDVKSQNFKEAIRIDGAGCKKGEVTREKVVSARRVLVPARRRSAPNFQPPPPPSFAPPPLPGSSDSPAAVSRRISLPSS